MKIAVLTVVLVVCFLSSCRVQGHRGWRRRWWWRSKTVEYTIRNVLSDPTFEHTQKVRLKNGGTFQRIMERAADNNSTFRFNAKFVDFETGYVITAINDVFGDDSSAWTFLRAPDELLSLGVSRYLPRNGEHLIMNLTSIPI